MSPPSADLWHAEVMFCECAAPLDGTCYVCRSAGWHMLRKTQSTKGGSVARHAGGPVERGLGPWLRERVPRLGPLTGVKRRPPSSRRRAPRARGRRNLSEPKAEGQERTPNRSPGALRARAMAEPLCDGGHAAGPEL